MGLKCMTPAVVLCSPLPAELPSQLGAGHFGVLLGKTHLRDSVPLLSVVFTSHLTLMGPLSVKVGQDRGGGEGW